MIQMLTEKTFFYIGPHSKHPFVMIRWHVQNGAEYYIIIFIFPIINSNSPSQVILLYYTFSFGHQEPFISVCGSLHLFPSVTGRCLSVDNWAMYQIWVGQNSIRNCFIDFFFLFSFGQSCLILHWVSGLSCHPGSIKPRLPLLMWVSSWTHL